MIDRPAAARCPRPAGCADDPGAGTPSVPRRALRVVHEPVEVDLAAAERAARDLLRALGVATDTGVTDRNARRETRTCRRAER